MIIHIRQAKVRASAKGFTGKQVHIEPKTSRSALGHSTGTLACEQALLFGRVRRVSRERASERRSREGPTLTLLAQIGELARRLQEYPTSQPRPQGFFQIRAAANMPFEKARLNICL